MTDCVKHHSKRNIGDILVNAGFIYVLSGILLLKNVIKGFTEDQLKNVTFLY